MLFTAADIPSQAGKVAIVTGANSGLGLATTAALAAAGATVVMACRDAGKAAAAVAQVQRHSPQAAVQVMPLDLASLASVRRFAATFKARHTRLDLLCNNAGVMALPLQRTAEGFEMQIGTNHFGHFVLTGELLDLLALTPTARIVNVASVAHRYFARGMNLDDPNFERRRYSKWNAYGQSKLANLLFTFELKRRLQARGSGIRAVAAHPGFARTNLASTSVSQRKASLESGLLQFAFNAFTQPAEMGALPTLYAATMPDVRSGDYFGPDGIGETRGHPTRVGCSRPARDAGLAECWWALSERLTGTKYLSD